MASGLCGQAVPWVSQWMLCAVQWCICGGDVVCRDATFGPIEQCDKCMHAQVVGEHAGDSESHKILIREVGNARNRVVVKAVKLPKRQ